MFTELQEKELASPLDGAHVKQRPGTNRQALSYVEGWQLIADANRIFGFGNWSRETLQMEPLHDPKLISDAEAPERGKVVACYFARVRVTVWAKDGTRSIVREGCGAARGFAKTAGEAMENAIKSAETDAMKRALVTFGDQFGLVLYDKELKNVTTRGSRRQPVEAREPPIDTGFEQHRAPTSQRALTATRRASGKLSDVTDLPV
jgi:recombination DNA repair RAD52 pathway protein